MTQSFFERRMTPTASRSLTHLDIGTSQKFSGACTFSCTSLLLKHMVKHKTAHDDGDDENRIVVLKDSIAVSLFTNRQICRIWYTNVYTTQQAKVLLCQFKYVVLQYLEI